MAMLAKMATYLAGIAAQKDRQAVRFVTEPLIDRSSSMNLTNQALVISSGGSTLAKIGAADQYVLANGKLQKIAAGTNMPALTGINTTGSNFIIVAFIIDQGGTVTVLGGTQSATLAGLIWPQIPKQKAVIGWALITNGGGFTGGTTPLDTATTVYLIGNDADPNMLVD